MYTFKYGDQEYQLVVANDLVVVRTDSETNLQNLPESSQSRDLVSNLVPVTTFPEVNVTVYKIVSADPKRVESVRNNMRRQLGQEKGVHYAGRVLRDKKTGTIFVYTENFFIKFHDDLSEEECESIIRDHHLHLKEKLVFAKNAYFAEASKGTGLKIFDIANQLLKMEEVESCHPELVREKTAKFIYPLQWHLRETTINGQFIDEDVSVEQAWETTKGEGITIAVIDDGFDVGHEEFQVPGKVVFPRNTVRNTDDARPLDPAERHGTACAGVACAAGEHKASGVAPAARLMPIKTGGLGSVAEAKAFAWAVDHGADVISCSWGPADGPWYDPAHPAHDHSFALPDSTRLALEYALKQGREGRGCVICWAAGNGNEDIRHDGYASNEGVIAVAACNDRGRRSVYSDFGAAIWCCFPSSDIYAPHLNHPRPRTSGIWTTDRRGANGYNSGGLSAESYYGDETGNYTATFGGTSSACPGVAGICALILAVNPTLHWQQVKDLVGQSCDSIDRQGGSYNAMGHSPFYGYGRINAAKAVAGALTLVEGGQPDIRGVAHFRKAGAVPWTTDRWEGDFEKEDRLLGLQLKLEPALPGLGIRYWVVLNGKGPSLPGENGSLSGTQDRRRKVIGFAVELTGERAAEFEIRYSAKVHGEKPPLQGRNGSVCGKAKGRGDAIEQVFISLYERTDLQPADS